MISPPASRRRPARIAATGFVAILTVVAAGCGGSQFPDSSHTTNVTPAPGAPSPASGAPSDTGASPPSTVVPKPTNRKPTNPKPTTPGQTTPETTTPKTTPTTTPRTTPTTSPAPLPTAVSLRSLVPTLDTLDTLGSQWGDDGESPSSRDLTDPPGECAPYTPVFDSRLDSVIHEFSFLPTADGNDEQGHIAMLSISAASTTAVTNELAGVLRSSYAPCAAATAVNWFNDHGEGTIESVSPRIVGLPVGGATVVWRVTIAGRSTSGTAGFFSMDIGYLARGATLVKIRTATCICRPPVTGDAELLPGELDALRSIALRLEGRDPALPATTPTNLN